MKLDPQFADKVKASITRAHMKHWVDIPELPEVSMPDDITDEEQFPNIAEARRYAREKGLG
jgi:hypothetical protein